MFLHRAYWIDDIDFHDYYNCLSSLIQLDSRIDININILYIFININIILMIIIIIRDYSINNFLNTHHCVNIFYVVFIVRANEDNFSRAPWTNEIREELARALLYHQLSLFFRTLLYQSVLEHSQVPPIIAENECPNN